MYQAIRPTPVLQTKKERSSVGCLILDRLLKGGLPCGSITEISGECASGKTQFCMQCCLSVLWPRHEGGLSGKALYIYTEGSHPTTRLQQIAELQQERLGKGKGKSALEDVLVHSQVGTTEELWVCLNQLPILLESQTDKPVRLVVIDSIANIFRELPDRPSVSDLRERSGFMFQTAAMLKKLAEERNFAVLVTNQVTDTVDDGNDVQNRNGVELRSCGRGVVPSLGLAWDNCVNTRLFASKVKCGDHIFRTLQVVFSPHLPQMRCAYEIRAEGIRGLTNAQVAQKLRSPQFAQLQENPHQEQATSR